MGGGQEQSLNRIEVAPSWGKRLAGIEGLRALAATTVLVAHVYDLASTGTDLGVGNRLVPLLSQGLTLFFALSGFLLYRPFAAALLTGHRGPVLRKYAWNRALRIYPAYIFVTLLVALVLGTANSAPLQPQLTERADRVGFISNPGLLALDLTMLQNLVPAGVQTGIGVAWTLTVELIFYLIMPLLALASGLIIRASGHRVLAALSPAIVLLALGLTAKLIGSYLFAGAAGDDAIVQLWGDSWSAVFARSFLMHADLFAFGMAAAVTIEIFMRRDFRDLLVRRSRWVSAGIGVACVVLAVLPLGFFRDTVFSCAAGALIFFVAAPTQGGGPGTLARLLDVAPLRFLGIISYSTYLWHVSVIWLVIRAEWLVTGQDAAAFALNSVVVLALTTAVATITYFLVERPSLRLKQLVDRRSDRVRNRRQSS